MTIDRHIDKFVFCCPDCLLVAEGLRHCPSCGKKLTVVKQGYIASIFGDTVLKTSFPEARKPAKMGDFPWVSVSRCPKCKSLFHFTDTCPNDGSALEIKIVKLSRACKKDKILFSRPGNCPVCAKPAIRVEEVHALKFAT